MIGRVTRPPLIKKKRKKKRERKKCARRATSLVFFLSQRKMSAYYFVNPEKPVTFNLMPEMRNALFSKKKKKILYKNAIFT